MNAYYVEALWGESDEGDYATYLWAEDPAKAAEACINEMNDNEVPPNKENEQEEYEIVNCLPLEEWIAQQEALVQAARQFIAHAPEE